MHHSVARAGREGSCAHTSRLETRAHTTSPHCGVAWHGVARRINIVRVVVRTLVDLARRINIPSDMFAEDGTSNNFMAPQMRHLK